MILLAIETATDMVGVALIGADGAAAERIHVGGRAHAELLVPAIEEVCAVSGCTISDVDCIAVDTGPGLFTGLRVGVATAKALAQALSVGVLGVSSLDVLAVAAAERCGPGTGEAVASVVDARRGEVFAATYRFDRTGGQADPASVRVDPGQPMTPDALAAWLADQAPAAGRMHVVGDGAVRYRPHLSSQASLDLGWADQLSAPPPVALARLARQRLDGGARPLVAADLVPDYRRPADARINWEQRAPQGTGPPARLPPG